MEIKFLTKLEEENAFKKLYKTINWEKEFQNYTHKDKKKRQSEIIQNIEYLLNQEEYCINEDRRDKLNWILNDIPIPEFSMLEYLKIEIKKLSNMLITQNY